MLSCLPQGRGVEQKKREEEEEEGERREANQVCMRCEDMGGHFKRCRISIAQERKLQISLDAGSSKKGVVHACS